MSANSKGPSLTFLNISKFDEDNDYLANVTCSFRAGTNNVVISKEASARRVLFRIAAGLDKPLGGDVQIDGKSLDSFPGLAKSKVFLVSLDLRFHLPATVSRLPELLGQNFENWDTKVFLHWVHELNIPMRAMYSELTFETQMRVLTALAMASGLPLVLLNDVETYLTMVEMRKIMQEFKARNKAQTTSTLLIGSSRISRWVDEDIEMVNLSRQQVYGISREVLRDRIVQSRGKPRANPAASAPGEFPDSEWVTEFTHTRTVV